LEWKASAWLAGNLANLPLKASQERTVKGLHPNKESRPWRMSSGGLLPFAKTWRACEL
jgi:hypothetical protein